MIRQKMRSQWANKFGDFLFFGIYFLQTLLANETISNTRLQPAK